MDQKFTISFIAHSWLCKNKVVCESRRKEAFGWVISGGCCIELYGDLIALINDGIRWDAIRDYSDLCRWFARYRCRHPADVRDPRILAVLVQVLEPRLVFVPLLLSPVARRPVHRSSPDAGWGQDRRIPSLVWGCSRRSWVFSTTGTGLRWTSWTHTTSI